MTGDLCPYSGLPSNLTSSDNSLELSWPWNSLSTKAIITAIYAILLVFGMCGNCIVVAVVNRINEKLSATSLMIVNLAVADLLILLVTLPINIVALHSPNRWLLGAEVCHSYLFIEWTAAHASILTLMIIATDRCYAVYRPLKASYTLTKCRAIGCIFLIWISAVAFSLPNVLLYDFCYIHDNSKKKIPRCHPNGPAWERSYYTAMLGALFFVPLVVLALMYAFICRKLKKNKHSLYEIKKTDDHVTQERRQVVFVLAVITIVLFLCLVPDRIFIMWQKWSLHDEGRDSAKEQRILLVLRIFLFFNSAINPVLYCLTSKKFRSSFFNLFCPAWYTNINDERRISTPL